MSLNLVGFEVEIVGNAIELSWIQWIGKSIWCYLTVKWLTLIQLKNLLDLRSQWDRINLISTHFDEFNWI